MVKLICVVFFTVVLKDSGRSVKLDPPTCDYSRRAVSKEGVLGSVSTFPWLGVLRVYLHETTLKIALTGIVLIKENYAIGNADDIARIPKRVFKDDTRAMFIPTDRAPWFCKPVDYVTHPEYEIETLNSIAVIELEPPEDTNFPMKPVCWPPYSYNTSNNLYAVGYTDENQLLEKFIYKLQYVDQDLCKEFYSRAGLSETNTAPKHYECGFAQNNKDSCVWDNGMALISNSSGRWVLVGLGLQGPGCAAPARFISLSQYYPWIEIVTQPGVEEDEENYRKSAFNDGFKKTEVEYIPAHELLRSNSTALDARRKQGNKDISQYYPKAVPDMDPFKIDRVSSTEIRIKFSKYNPYRLGSYGDCSNKNIHIVYKDYIEVLSRTKDSPGHHGIVQYMITLHDPMFMNYTCVTLKLHVKQSSSAYLYYDTVITDTGFSETPEEIIRVYPFYTQTKLVKKEKTDSFYQDPIKSPGFPIFGHNVNLYLKIAFEGNCRLEIRFFGPIAVASTMVPSAFDTTTDKNKKKTTTSLTTTTTTTPTPTLLRSSLLTKNMPLELKLANEVVDMEADAVFSKANDKKGRVMIWIVVSFGLVFVNLNLYICTDFYLL